MKVYAIVRLKPGVPDGPSKSIMGDIKAGGYAVASVVGAKFFQIELAGLEYWKADALVRKVCKDLLANPVIEEFVCWMEPAEIEQVRQEILAKINKMVSPHGLRAEFLGTASSVGVMGDERTDTPVIALVGPYPDDAVLEEISSAITNNTGINRVTIDLTSAFPPTTA